jgi:hypothetical protein
MLTGGTAIRSSAIVGGSRGTGHAPEDDSALHSLLAIADHIDTARQIRSFASRLLREGNLVSKRIGVLA